MTQKQQQLRSPKAHSWLYFKTIGLNLNQKIKALVSNKLNYWDWGIKSKESPKLNKSLLG